MLNTGIGWGLPIQWPTYLLPLLTVQKVGNRNLVQKKIIGKSQGNQIFQILLPSTLKAVLNKEISPYNITSST